MNRSRPDRCPGALRPWPADDGLLVRLRLPGGHVTSRQLLALLTTAERHGDGRVYVTTRANLQVRGLPAAAGTTHLTSEALEALVSTGLLPSLAHDLARNILVSPQTGLAHGRADLRSVTAALDGALTDAPDLAALPGRFLFVLDDGRGDLVERSCDLGLVALDAVRGQVRVGDAWGPVVPLRSAHRYLAGLARRFLAVRGHGKSAAWHVRELAEPLELPQRPSSLLPTARARLPYGSVPGGRHVPVPEEGLDRPAVEQLCADASHLVVTPWRGVLIPEETA